MTIQRMKIPGITYLMSPNETSIYVRIAKCASVSIISWLLHNDWKHIESLDQYPHAMKWTAVRNPYERHMSGWTQQWNTVAEQYGIPAMQAIVESLDIHHAIFGHTIPLYKCLVPGHSQSVILPLDGTVIASYLKYKECEPTGELPVFHTTENNVRKGGLKHEIAQALHSHIEKSFYYDLTTNEYDSKIYNFYNQHSELTWQEYENKSINFLINIENK